MTSYDNARDRICIALDGIPNVRLACQSVEDLAQRAGTFKLGLSTVTYCGPEVFREVKKFGVKVFADFKLDDVPHQVLPTLEALAELNVDYVTLHIKNNREMLEAAVAALRERSDPPKLLGVTVLTTENPPREELERLITEKTTLAYDVGLYGIICSGRDLIDFGEKIPKGLYKVTPGIIVPGYEGSQHQKRTCIVNEAIQAGSDMIVVGTSIMKYRDRENRVKAAQKVLELVLAA